MRMVMEQECMMQSEETRNSTRIINCSIRGVMQQAQKNNGGITVMNYEYEAFHHDDI